MLGFRESVLTSRLRDLTCTHIWFVLIAVLVGGFRLIKYFSDADLREVLFIGVRVGGYIQVRVPRYPLGWCTLVVGIESGANSDKFYGLKSVAFLCLTLLSPGDDGAESVVRVQFPCPTPKNPLTLISRWESVGRTQRELCPRSYGFRSALSGDDHFASLCGRFFAFDAAVPWNVVCDEFYYCL